MLASVLSIHIYLVMKHQHCDPTANRLDPYCLSLQPNVLQSFCVHLSCWHPFHTQANSWLQQMNHGRFGNLSMQMMLWEWFWHCVQVAIKQFQHYHSGSMQEQAPRLCLPFPDSHCSLWLSKVVLSPVILWYVLWTMLKTSKGSYHEQWSHWCQHLLPKEPPALLGYYFDRLCAVAC